MADDIVTAREIRLVDADGKVAAILRAETPKTLGQPHTVFCIFDKDNRARFQLTMSDEDPGQPNRSTVIHVWDVGGDRLWDSIDPSIPTFPS